MGNPFRWRRSVSAWAGRGWWARGKEFFGISRDGGSGAVPLLSRLSLLSLLNGSMRMIAVRCHVAFNGQDITRGGGNSFLIKELKDDTVKLERRNNKVFKTRV